MRTEEQKLKRREAVRRYRERNRDKINELQRKKRKTPEAKEKHRLKMKQWRVDNPEKQKDVHKRFRAKHSDRINEERRNRYHSDESYRQKKSDLEKAYKLSGRRAEVNRMNPKTRERVKNYRLNNPEKIAKKFREYKDRFWIAHEKEQRDNLDDRYVVKVIKKQTKFTLKTEEIPQSLIELKRQSIKLKRLIKHKTNE